MLSCMWRIICKYDITYKTGNIKRVATPPEVKIGRVFPEICSRTSEHTNTQPRLLRVPLPRNIGEVNFLTHTVNDFACF